MQNNGLRQTVVKTILALIRALIEPGVLTVSEYSVIAKNLTHLAKYGELAPPVQHRLITGKEAAEMLAISYSQFRQLESDGVFAPYFNVNNYYTLRTDDELDRFVSLANQIEKSVNSGNFYPNETGFGCAECPYRDRCKKWR